jgi:hypothetical protein
MINSITESFAGTRPLLGRQSLGKATETETTPSFGVRYRRSWIVDEDIPASGTSFFAVSLKNCHSLGESCPERRGRLLLLGACGS